jgi:tRNA modification GTPase
LSSGSVPSGVAVIRISGPLAAEAIANLCGPPVAPRRAVLRTLHIPRDGAVIDRGIVLWFPGPRSETGEDMVELQLHGSRAVVQAVFEVLAESGMRLARPGEFARRAFENGKIDLTEVEGLADLVAAETEVQRRQAIAQAGGALARRAADWRERLLDLRAEIEARLDFSDEGDVPAELPASFWAAVAELADDIRAVVSGAASGERVRDGFRVAILGRPNAGKSSLLNALAQRDVAIVTEEPGTTRDVLEVPLDIAGYPVVVFDTAGLREAASLAEIEGVRRATRTAEEADLVLWLEDSTTQPEHAPPMRAGTMWRVSTKIDLAPGREELGVSAKTGQGLAGLIERIGKAARESLGRGDSLVTRRRQREALVAAGTALDAIPGSTEEVAADLLRTAGDAIGRLSGRIDVDDVLDRLFAEFCIGK